MCNDFYQVVIKLIISHFNMPSTTRIHAQYQMLFVMSLNGNWSLQ